MLLSQGYLFCVCVCVYPSGNSCPDGISSLREACNQLILRCSSLRPGRCSEKRGEENEKGGRAVQLFKAAHSRTSLRNSWLHMSGVPVLLSNMYPCPFLWSPPLYMLCFSLSVPFCFRLLSPAPAFVLLGSETTKWCCLPLLLSARSRCCFRTQWLTEGVCVFTTFSVHLLNKRRLCPCASFWPWGQHLI